MTTVQRVVLVAALLWAALLLHRGLGLAVDEIEFFRATAWVGEGQVPFRDFWEHHAPLQWIVFAPIARLFATGAGAEAIVIMRWAQAACWLATFLLLGSAARRLAPGWSVALLLLVTSPVFLLRALEYRVDALGNLAFVAGVVILLRSPAQSREWAAFGALLSAAVLVNMRLAPLAVLAALLAVSWRGGDESPRWGWNPRALWSAAGVFAVAVPFVAWLFATGAWGAFVEGVVRYNSVSGDLLEVSTFFDALLAPLWVLDVSGIAFYAAAAGGLLLCLRSLRHPGPLEVTAILLVGSLVTVGLMRVHYDYHFQTSWLLMLPVGGLAIGRVGERWRPLLIGIAVVGLLVSVAQRVAAFGAEMEYQDAVMETADRLTEPGETVFDGAGYALRREPAYRYWFLTTGVRMMANGGLIQRYDTRALLADPPAAVIADYRMRIYLKADRELASTLTRSYLPLYRNLWVPGMTALVRPGNAVSVWVVPRAGRYRVVASELLVRHPWLTEPLAYAATSGPAAARLAIPLEQLPAADPGRMRWTVDGVVQPSGVTMLRLARGARVELEAGFIRPTGVLLVPEGIGTLAVAPEDPFLF